MFISRAPIRALCPQALVIAISELPLTPTGKLDRERLRKVSIELAALEEEEDDHSPNGDANGGSSAGDSGFDSMQVLQRESNHSSQQTSARGIVTYHLCALPPARTS